MRGLIIVLLAVIAAASVGSAVAIVNSSRRGLAVEAALQEPNFTSSHVEYGSAGDGQDELHHGKAW